MIQLETERLYLKDYQRDDFPDYYDLRHNRKVIYYLPDIYLPNPQEGIKDFHIVCNDKLNPNRIYYFLKMIRKEDNTFIGSIGYTIVDKREHNRTGALGYFIYPQYWNMGYTTEAVNAVIHYAFTEGNIDVMTTGCLTENIASERVMQKCGMTKTAQYDNLVYHDKQYKTRVEYQITKQEYLKNPS